MKLKHLFLLGDIGYFNKNLLGVTNLIKKDIQMNEPIILLGDNFYDNGVKSIDDLQWRSYDKYFKNFKNPIYSILGNHDYLQNPKAQIDTNRWIMPNWYFKKEYENVDLYFLDTVQFHISTWVSKEKIERVHNDTIDSLIEKQINWLGKEINKNKNKRKIVFGHYPLISYGVYMDKLKPLYDKLYDVFKKYNIDIYISGHEHNIQYIRDNDKFNQIIVGSSSEFRDKENSYCAPNQMLDKSDIYYSKIIIDEKIKIQFINIKGEIRYEYEI